jgi:hypothetical protein
MKRIVIVTCILALAGCKMLGKKDDAAGDAAATVTSATAPTDSATPADSTASNTPTGHGVAAPASQPGVVTDPNASPNVEANDTQAHAEINKGNYKKELDSLEKEDLNADKK